MAIITGTSVHKAMMLDAKNIGHVVRAGDVIGKEPYRHPHHAERGRAQAAAAARARAAAGPRNREEAPW
jgi:hypothetical protein